MPPKKTGSKDISSLETISQQLSDLREKFHLQKLPSLLKEITLLVNEARSIGLPVEKRIACYEEVITYFSQLADILLKRPLSEQPSLSRHQKKITTQIAVFHKELSLLQGLKKTELQTIPFEQLDSKCQSLLKKHVVLPIMYPNFYQKDYQALVITGPEKNGKTFIIKSMIDYLDSNKISFFFLELNGKSSQVRTKHQNLPSTNHVEDLIKDLQYISQKPNPKSTIVLLDDIDLYLEKSEYEYQLEQLRELSYLPYIFVIATCSKSLELLTPSLRSFFQKEINLDCLQQSDIANFFNFHIYQHLTHHLWKTKTNDFRQELRIPLIKPELYNLAYQLASENKKPGYRDLKNILSTSINTASLAALHNNKFYPLQYNKERVLLSSLSFQHTQMPKISPVVINPPSVKSITLDDTLYHHSDCKTFPYHLEDERINNVFIAKEKKDDNSFDMIGTFDLEVTTQNSFNQVLYQIYHQLLILFVNVLKRLNIVSIDSPRDLYNLDPSTMEKVGHLFHQIVHKPNEFAQHHQEKLNTMEQTIMVTTNKTNENSNTTFNLSYGNRSSRQISKYSKGIPLKLDADRMRQLILYLITGKITTEDPLVFQEGLFDVTVEMTVIDTSVQKGTIWKIKCSQEFEETSKTRTPYQMELFHINSTSKNVRTAVMGSVSISSDQIKIPSNYEISNEADIDYLQEKYSHQYQDMYSEETDTWRHQQLRDPSHIDFLNNTYRSEERYHVSLLHFMNLFQKHYQGFLSSSMNIQFEELYLYLQHSIDRLLHITDEYDDNEWNEMWSVSSNHDRKISKNKEHQKLEKISLLHQKSKRGGEKKEFYLKNYQHAMKQNQENTMQDLIQKSMRKSVTEAYRQTLQDEQQQQQQQAEPYQQGGAEEESSSEEEDEPHVARIRSHLDVFVSWHLIPMLFASTNVLQYQTLSDILDYHQRYYYARQKSRMDRIYLQSLIPQEYISQSSDKYYHSQLLIEKYSGIYGYSDPENSHIQQVEWLKRLQKKTSPGHSLYFDLWRHVQKIGIQSGQSIKWFSPPRHPVLNHWHEIGHAHLQKHSLSSLLNIVGNCDHPSWYRLMVGHLLSSQNKDKREQSNIYLGLLAYPLQFQVDNPDNNLLSSAQEQLTLPILRYRYQYLRKFLPNISIPLRVEGARGKIKGSRDMCVGLPKTVFKADAISSPPAKSTQIDPLLRSLHIRKEYLEEAALQYLLN